MPEHFDFQGLAILIGAMSVGVVTIATGIVNVVLQILTFNRQGRIEAVSRMTNLDMAHVKNALDGQSEKLNVAIDRAAHAEGTAEGIAKERADPQTSSSSTIATK